MAPLIDIHTHVHTYIHTHSQWRMYSLLRRGLEGRMIDFGWSILALWNETACFFYRRDVYDMLCVLVFRYLCRVYAPCDIYVCVWYITSVPLPNSSRHHPSSITLPNWLQIHSAEERFECNQICHTLCQSNGILCWVGSMPVLVLVWWLTCLIEMYDWDIWLTCLTDMFDWDIWLGCLTISFGPALPSWRLLRHTGEMLNNRAVTT